MRQRGALLVLLVLAGAAAWGCDDGSADGDGDADSDADGDADGELDISVCDPDTGPFTLEIDNPFFPLVVGHRLVLQGNEGSTELRVEVTVLDETEEVAGVTTRVVEERETEDGELVEVSRNFFAQAPDGTVCYFGEDVDDYEDGEVVGHGGAWRAEGENRAGIIMPAEPAVGMSYDQEVADGVAEDHGEIASMGDQITVPAGTYDDTLTVIESSPLDSGTSRKVYARDVGMIVDEEIELISD